MSERSWSLGKSALFGAVALAAALLVNQMVGCMSAAAQVPSADAIESAVVPGESSADDLIVHMSRSAGTVFAGQVTDIRRPVGFAALNQSAAEGVTEIDFRVDQPVRGDGITSGSTYTLREWGGRWSGNTEPYQVGQRLLVFLHRPNANGFSSTVQGAEGAIPLRGGGTAPGPDDATTTPAEWMVDLRWVQAQGTRRSSSSRGPKPGPVPVENPSRDRQSHAFIGADPAASKSTPLPELSVPWLDSPLLATSSPEPAAFQPLARVIALCREPIRIRDEAR